MKKRINLALFAAFLGVLASSLILAQVYAQGAGQGGRIDSSTFLIPYAVDQLDEQFNAGRNPLLTITNIETTISIAVLRPGTIIYYDHWEEDGLEGDLTFPTQPSTQVWGDNDPSNGMPPLYTTDVFTTGSVITLRNPVPVDYANRDPNNPFLFDGGDALTGVGGTLAITFMIWPLNPATPDRPGILYTDAWELYPTNRWDTDYIVPIGQNLANQRPSFAVVGLNVQAIQDNTNIQLDTNGDGFTDLTMTLDYGEQASLIDGISVGARVQASAPVQVHVFASDPARTYEARGYTPIPVSQWTADYLASRSSDGDFWLYNPDPTSFLTVQAQTITGTQMIVIPPISTTKFPPAGQSAATGIHFTSTDGRPFYGMVALDGADAQDWGYDLMPTLNLTPQVLVGLGIGNNSDPIPPFNPNNDESPIYVTAITPTILSVDYNNDGNPEANFPAAALAEVRITDPDHDLTGAFMFTNDNTPFVAVWGQDALAFPGLPAIDAGANIIPLPSLLLQKTFTLSEDRDCNGFISPDDNVQFELEYFNSTIYDINQIVITDTLPAALTYIPDSIIINGVPISDSAGSTALFASTGYHVGTVPALQSGQLTFNTRVNSTTDPVINRAGARSQDLPLGGDSVTVFIPTSAITPVLQLSTTLVEPVDAVITTGQVITFGLTLTNTGSATITSLPLQNSFSQAYLDFRSAVPPPTLTAAGVITWSDLVTFLGELPPGGTLNLNVSFVVTQIPPPATSLFNKMTVLQAQQNNTPLPLTCTAETRVNLATPTPTPTPTSTASPTSPATPTATPTTPSTSGETPTPPTGTPPPKSPTSPPPGDGDDDPPAPSPSLTPTIPFTPPATSTPPFPVTYLPTTGSGGGWSKIMAVSGMLLLLALAGMGVGPLWRWLTQKGRD